MTSDSRAEEGDNQEYLGGLGMGAGPLSLRRWLVRLHHGEWRRKTSQVDNQHSDTQSTCLWEELRKWKEKKDATEGEGTF